jgi:hypothetical protein
MPCSCKKSGCTNNRCSCYKEGTACTSECECEDCENGSVPDSGVEEEGSEQDEDTLVGCLILLVLFLVLYFWFW